MQSDPRSEALLAAFARGRITRRQLLHRAAALGLAVPALAALPGAAALAQTPAAGDANLTGQLTLWHGWTGAEASTLNDDILPLWQKLYPNVKVNVLAVPFDQLKNKYSTEAATGGGPDLLIGSLDWIGELASGELIKPLDDLADESWKSHYIPSTVEALVYNDKLYAVPESFEAVALFYNKDQVPTPPASTKDLEDIAAKAASGTYGFALLSNFYHPAGLFFGFGGKLFDDQKMSAIDSPETVKFLTWLAALKGKPGVFMQNDDAAISSLFKEGKASMVLNGPWALGDYQGALGKDKVGVAVQPKISENGDAAPKPFLGVKNLMVNANAAADQAKLAFTFATWFTSPDSEKFLVEKAGHLPAHTGVDVSQDPIASAFVEQAKDATPLPTIPEMSQVWDPAGAMITQVLEGAKTPDAAAKEAQDKINQGIKNMQA
jgi:arabinogalactan oligomer/maltooligosaccharide transport system substrate-binding protein